MSTEFENPGVTETNKARDEFWVAYAEAFAQPLQANGLLSRFVTNQAVTGDYAEAWIRSMTRSMVGHRFRVSTGAVIRASGAIRGVPQCDLIVWDPSEMPAVFESGEFALVPLFAARAIIEVERSMSTTEKLPEQLKKRTELLPKFGPVFGVVINHPKPLFKGECGPNWLERYKYDSPTGCYKTDEPPMTRLLDDENKPDTNGIMAFIYFLAQVAGHTT